jgi:hypothetical protein
MVLFIWIYFHDKASNKDKITISSMHVDCRSYLTLTSTNYRITIPPLSFEENPEGTRKHSWKKINTAEVHSKFCVLVIVGKRRPERTRYNLEIMYKGYVHSPQIICKIRVKPRML